MQMATLPRFQTSLTAESIHIYIRNQNWKISRNVWTKKSRDFNKTPSYCEVTPGTTCMHYERPPESLIHVCKYH